MIAVLALLACATPSVEAPAPDAAEIEDAVLSVGSPPDEVVVTLASAWMDPGGSGGHGLDASAVVPGPPELVISGPKSSWDLAKGVVVFEGGVTATRGDVRIACARLEVTYADQRVQSAVATGSVVVTRGTREAHGERATLAVSSGRLEITGSPTIHDGPNVLSGTSIVLFLDDERLECDGCRLQIAGSAVAPR